MCVDGDEYHVHTTTHEPSVTTTSAPGGHDDSSSGDGAYDGAPGAGSGAADDAAPKSSLVFTLQLANETPESFDSAKREAFRGAIAETLDVAPAAVALEVRYYSSTPGRRRLSSGGASSSSSS